MKVIPRILAIVLVAILAACSAGQPSVVPAQLEVASTLDLSKDTIMQRGLEIGLNEVLIQKGFEIEQFHHHEINLTEITFSGNELDASWVFELYLQSEDLTTEIYLGKTQLPFDGFFQCTENKVDEVFENGQKFNLKLINISDKRTEKSEEQLDFTIKFKTESHSFVFS